MATQKEIKEAYEGFNDEIFGLEGEIEITRARIKVNQRKCKHPNSYTYYAMGEAGTMCPDCGSST